MYFICSKDPTPTGWTHTPPIGSPRKDLNLPLSDIKCF